LNRAPFKRSALGPEMNMFRSEGNRFRFEMNLFIFGLNRFKSALKFFIFYLNRFR
jgi:hypothetical protein